MNFRTLVCLLAFWVCGTLQGTVQKQAATDVKHKRYNHLGKLIKKNVGNGLTLTELKKMGKKYKSKPLLYAIDATRKIKKYHVNLTLNRAEILQTALFIETGLPKYAKKHTYYLPKKKTGLAHTVEHDPKNKTSFIVLTGKEAYIGKGAKKTVHKAIHYNHRHPKVVARAVDCTKKTREHAITKKLHKVPGIFKTIGFGKNKEHGKTYSTIYSKLYRPGSLEEAFERKVALSTYEKMKVAYEILQGLYSLHKRGIVHRDLGARNYLIDIPKDKPGYRKVTACIADLGRATYAKHAARTKVQGNTTYTAPEGIYLRNMTGKDYYKSDIFAVGCVFYRLIHGKKAPWQDRSYVKDTKHSLYANYLKLRHRIKYVTKERRAHLINKRKLSPRKLSPKEQFELLTLRMLHTDRSKRGSAKQLVAKMKKIYASVR